MRWQHARGFLTLGERPVLMGILNVTPDSFSDGGLHFSLDGALRRAEQQIAAGAVILDVGGESTRPGAMPVDEEEELRRVVPVLREIRCRWPDVLLSIDTYKSRVAREALEAGAVIINDVSGGRWDEALLSVVAESKAAYICMHSLDRPDRMQLNPVYQNVAAEVGLFLRDLCGRLDGLGVSRERLAVDPGLGFGKTPEHNLTLIRAASDWAAFGRPVVWGLSRKSFISRLLGVGPEERLTGGLAAHAWLLRQPHPQIWRVHEVEAYARLWKMSFLLDRGTDSTAS